MTVESRQIDPAIQAKMPPPMTDKEYDRYLWYWSGNTEKIYAGLSILCLGAIALHYLGVF